MLVVGLTGNIGSGKSTVAQLIAKRGVSVVDADLLAREAVAPGSPALERIVARWGRGILSPDGSLDRAALGARVFGHVSELDALNGIVHPEVGRRRDALIARARARAERIVVCDIPLLYEARAEADVDMVVLVDAPCELRLERLITNRKFSATVAEAIMESQMAAERKRDLADYVIENSGTLGALERRVNQVWSDIETRAARAAS